MSATEQPQATGDAPTAEQAWEVLRKVLDPELQLNIVDLGLVYGIEIKDGSVVHVKMTLTTPHCPYGPALLSQAEDMLRTLKGVKGVELELVWSPPWGPDRMSPETRLELGLDV